MSMLSYVLRFCFVFIIGVQVTMTADVAFDSGDGVMHYCAIPNFACVDAVRMKNECDE